MAASEPFEKLERGTLPDQIVAGLRARIVSGELKPGARIPAEQQLAEMFGVGRGTVREAIKALTLMRVLERTTKGTFVAATAELYVAQDLVARLVQDDPEFEDSYETRQMLETQIVRLACERATEEDLAQLEDAIERHKVAVTGVERLQTDLDYHRALVRAAHNTVLSHLYMLLMESIARGYKTFVLAMEEPGTVEWGSTTHSDTVAAIRARDAETAQKIVEGSMVAAAKRLADAEQKARAAAKKGKTDRT